MLLLEHGIKINIFKLPSNKRLRSSCILLHYTGVICSDYASLFSDREICYRNTKSVIVDKVVRGIFSLLVDTV